MARDVDRTKLTPGHDRFTPIPDKKSSILYTILIFMCYRLTWCWFVPKNHAIAHLEMTLMQVTLTKVTFTAI